MISFDSQNNTDLFISMQAVYIQCKNRFHFESDYHVTALIQSESGSKVRPMRIFQMLLIKGTFWTEHE